MFNGEIISGVMMDFVMEIFVFWIIMLGMSSCLTKYQHEKNVAKVPCAFIIEFGP